MKSLFSYLAVTCACIGMIVPVNAHASVLTVGDPAPTLAVKSFLKGTPVSALPKGQVSVVAFWTTSSMPSREAMPQLTALAKRYPRVTFIGVDVWEKDAALVGPYVKAMGVKMDFRIATDRGTPGAKPAAGAMATNWLEAAGQHTVPVVFLVGKDSKIAWIGPPTSLADPLAKVVAGTWNLAGAVAEANKQQADTQLLSTLHADLKKEALAKNEAQFVASLNTALTAHPDWEKVTPGNLGTLKFICLLKAGDTEAAITYGKHLVADIYPDNADALDTLAVASIAPDSWATILPADWSPLFPPKPDTASEESAKPNPTLAAFALHAAERSDIAAQGQSAEVADTLAIARFATGDATGAVAAEIRAIRLCGTPTGSREVEALTEMRHQLAIYQKAATAGK